jgi:hypothetical protein
MKKRPLFLLRFIIYHLFPPKRGISLCSTFIIFSCSLSAQCISGDCKNGVGTYIYPSGAKYTGHFKNGEIHGVGVCYYTDGSKYQGEWVYRYPEGRGTKTYSDGTARTGLWRRGKPVDDNGKLLEEYIAKKKDERQDDGTNIQSGCLSGDCKNGQGVFAYPDGSKYEGQFVNGKFEGQGIFHFANGDTYQGQFKENFPDGQGTRTYAANGHQETGDWRQGEFFGSSLIESGKVGCTQGDCANGKGTYIYREGAAKYVGDFKNELPDGYGICTYANGDRYRGEWQEGAFWGKGALYLRDGTVVDGYWRNGEYIGKEPPADYKPSTPPVTETTPQPPVGERPDTKVWAVVVGVASYNHMPVLRYTDDDAYRFYAFLKSLEGGALPDEQLRVVVDEDATRDNVLGTMNEIFNQAGPNDLVIFYFSGHGLNGSFLPIDFDGFNNKITHEEIAKIFNKSRAKFKLCLADACHSGSLFAMRSGEDDPILNTYYTALAKSVSGTALIMSSKADETSLESQGLRQGVFSHFLIRGLKGEADKNKDKVVTVGELYDFIAANVRDYTGNRQSPVIKGTYDPKMPVAVSR